MSDVNRASTAAVPKFVYEPDANAGTFVMLIAQEDIATVDGRMFSPGAIDWRELPIPLTLNRTNSAEGQHKTAVGIGAITEIWRDGNNIYGRGFFSADDAGQEARNLIKEGTISGVSADVGGVISEEMASDAPEGVNRLFTKGTIIGVTALLHASFNDTKIAVEDDALTAAAARGWAPPSDAFVNPNLSRPTPLTVTEDGRVFGHAAVWGTCHVGYRDRCVTPPRSNKGYQFFNTGQVLTNDGKTLPVGRITANTGHAAIELAAQPAKEHYDHTGFAAAYVNAGEDEHGIWFSGVVAPDATPAQVANLRAAGVSGDWRNIGGSLEMVGLLAVNTPGFPVPRASIVAGAQMSLVAAGFVGMESGVAPGLVDKLRTLLADTDTVVHQAQGYHWNVRGADFAQYHELFGDIYGDLYGSIDPIAENILKLEADSPFSLSDFTEMRSIPDAMPCVTAKDMMTALHMSVKALIGSLNVAFEAASVADQQGVANFLADRIDATQKWEWQLRRSLDCGCGCGGGEGCEGDDEDEDEMEDGEEEMVPQVIMVPASLAASGTEDCGCHGTKKKRMAAQQPVEMASTDPVDWTSDLDSTFLTQVRQHLIDLVQLAEQVNTSGSRLSLPVQSYAGHIETVARPEIDVLDRSLNRMSDSERKEDVAEGKEINEVPDTAYESTSVLSFEALLTLMDLDIDSIV